MFCASGIAGKRVHNIVLTNFYIFAAMPHKAALAQGASYGRHANILRPAIMALASFQSVATTASSTRRGNNPCTGKFLLFFLFQFTGESYEHSDSEQNASFLAPV